MKWTCTAGSEQDLRDAAKIIFEKLKQQWLEYPDYWHLGHSFDTIIDYFAYVDKTEAAAFSPTAQAAYKRTLGSACLYDDFGWWGIAALKAARSKLFSDADVQTFTNISNDCWAMMHDNAPNVWANNKDNPDFKPLEPRIPGGVWNTDWSRPDGCGNLHKAPDFSSTCWPGFDKHPFNLEGIQNTVTNGLYLVLALRLHQATKDITKDTVYRDAAKLEYDFLNQWLKLGSPSDPSLPSSDISLLLKLREPQGYYTYGLVRERVATYTNGLHVCGYESGLVWSGDQGLIVGAMIDRMIVEPDDDNSNSDACKYAVAILLGVVDVTNRESAGIVIPWIKGNGGDPEDYSTGPGVFMRYLLYADQTNESLIRSHTRTPAYQSLISANATQALKQKEIGGDLTSLTNALAILVAAIVMSKN
jgi:hypothetical protein